MKIMRYPNFSEEKKLWDQGYDFVVGLDEAGRGPLAGPVVAAAVMVSMHSKKRTYKLEDVRMFLKMRDSKEIPEKKREYFYNKLIDHKDIKWGIGVVSEKVIDKINILEATKLAMNRAVKDLSSNLESFPNLKTKDFFLILDGNFKINVPIPQKSIVAADQKVFSCVAAGIIAKVTRDIMMRDYHKKYPHYGFNFHKGYGTELHVKNLRKFGPCKIHRKSFYPVSIML